LRASGTNLAFHLGQGVEKPVRLQNASKYGRRRCTIIGRRGRE